MKPFEQWLQADILSLGMAADEARRAVASGVAVVTYRRVHVVDPGGADAPVPDAAAEIRSHQTPATLDEAIAHVRALRAAAGPRRVAAFSMADLHARAGAGWGPLAGVLEQLAAAGLDDVAEMPADRVPDLTACVRAALDAGLRPARVTVADPLDGRPLDVLDRIRACVEATGYPTSVSPLPRQVPADTPTTGYADLRTIALARLMLGAAGGGRPPARIEVDWTLYGPKLAQVALTFGADHLDAVSATDDESLGPRRGPVSDVERNIRAAGYEPREERS